MPSCVIVVENLPVPLDRRVWQEARALKEAGWVVSVICPATPTFPAHRETIDGIQIFRHSLPFEARGALGFLTEYTVALWHEFRLLFSVHFAVGFDVIQACNPPDLIFLVALPWKLFGKRFVFDHHDVCPELLEAKFGRRRYLTALLLLLEKLSFKCANLVISSNETFRQIAISRGGKQPEDVVAVYSIPDRRYFANTSGSRAGLHSDKLVIGYVGIIGDQDGVDNIVRMAQELSARGHRDKFVCVIIGDGPALTSVKNLASMTDCDIQFSGYLSGSALLERLSSFDIGIIPDPSNPYNDKISMNKVFEYSAMGIPIVAFELTETKRLLRDAALFAQPPDAQGLADQVERLLIDSELRHRMGQMALALAERNFDWKVEAAKYVAAMDQVSR